MLTISKIIKFLQKLDQSIDQIKQIWIDKNERQLSISVDGEPSIIPLDRPKGIRKNRKKNLLFSTRVLQWHQDPHCSYCGVKTWLPYPNCLDNETMATIDHIHPSSLGGEDQLDNYVLACHRCNCFRSNKRIITFLKLSTYEESQRISYSSIKS